MPNSLLLDTNILVSYLLAPSNRNSTIAEIVHAALSDRFVWLVPHEQLSELQNLLRRQYFVERITPDEWAVFSESLDGAAVVLSRQQRPFPKVARDPKDDYLIAIAIWHNVEILVSGDKDLLALQEHLDRPRIMSPADFMVEFATA